MYEDRIDFWQSLDERDARLCSDPGYWQSLLSSPPAGPSNRELATLWYGAIKQAQQLPGIGQTINAYLATVNEALRVASAVMAEVEPQQLERLLTWLEGQIQALRRKGYYVSAPPGSKLLPVYAPGKAIVLQKGDEKMLQGLGFRPTAETRLITIKSKVVEAVKWWLLRKGCQSSLDKAGWKKQDVFHHFPEHF